MANRVKTDLDGSDDHEPRGSAILIGIRKFGDDLEDSAPELSRNSIARLRQAAQVLSLVAEGDARTTGLRAAGNALEEETPPFDSEAGADRLRQTARVLGSLPAEDDDAERAELEETRRRTTETVQLHLSYYEQIQQQLAHRREQIRQLETQLRDLERLNTMRYDMELARLKAQSEVVASAIDRGLADRRDVEHVTSVLNGVIKRLQIGPSESSQPETLPEQDPDQNADGSTSVTSLGAMELSSADAERMAGMFRALADPIRLRLFSKVATHRSGEASVCDIQSMGISTPTVSYHLKKLREAGLIVAERRGTWVYCRVMPGVLPAMAAILTGSSASTGSDELAVEQRPHDEGPAVSGNDVESDRDFTHIVLIGNS